MEYCTSLQTIDLYKYFNTYNVHTVQLVCICNRGLHSFKVFKRLAIIAFFMISCVASGSSPVTVPMKTYFMKEYINYVSSHVYIMVLPT